MGMRTVGILVLIGTVIVCAAIPGGANGGKTTITNVTTVFHDTDSTDAQLLMKSDDYNGSGEATYSAADVPSYIFSGAWYLRLYGQSVRTLYITPNDAINGSQPTAPPPGYYWQNVEVVVECYDQNLNMVPLSNILTTSGNCKMIVDLGYNGTEYAMVMGPTGSMPAPGPASGLVSVTCDSVSSGQCVKWTITPNSTASSSNPPTVANLYRFTGRHPALAFVGQYYQTFRIDLTNP